MHIPVVDGWRSLIFGEAVCRTDEEVTGKTLCAQDHRVYLQHNIWNLPVSVQERPVWKLACCIVHKLPICRFRQNIQFVWYYNWITTFRLQFWSNRCAHVIFRIRISVIPSARQQGAVDWFVEAEFRVQRLCKGVRAKVGWHRATGRKTISGRARSFAKNLKRLIFIFM